MARYLGIEVTEGQLKGVVLRTAYRKLQIESVVRVPRAAGNEGITRAAQDVVAQVRASGGIDAVYSAMAGTEASMRMLELPRAVAKRASRVIATELEGSLPFDIDAAVVDAQVVRQNAIVELLAAAVRKERVQAFIEALKAAGAEPREVGIAPIALGDLAAEIPDLAQPGPVLLLHAYESMADFTILEGGVVQMARTLGGQTTPAARARGVRQTLGAYLAAGGKAPTVAYLVGESAGFNMDVVADASGLPPEAVRLELPLGPIELGPGVAPAEPAMAPLAVALALRGLGRTSRIDLRKGDLAIAGGSQILRERAWLIAACVAGVVASWGFATYTRYASVSDERDRLVQALGRVTQDVFDQKVTDPQRAKALAVGGGPDREEDPQPLVDAFDVIGALSARIPDNIHHDITQLDISDEHVTLQGLVDSLEQRDRIVEALGSYECFQNIQPGRAQRNPGDNRQQYTLDFELRCPERQQTGPRRGGQGGRQGGGGTGGSSSTGGSSGSGV